jgi:hypothetical protein
MLIHVAREAKASQVVEYTWSTPGKLWKVWLGVWPVKTWRNTTCESNTFAKLKAATVYISMPMGINQSTTR